MDPIFTQSQLCPQALSTRSTQVESQVAEQQDGRASQIASTQLVAAGGVSQNSVSASPSLHRVWAQEPALSSQIRLPQSVRTDSMHCASQAVVQHDGSWVQI